MDFTVSEYVPRPFSDVVADLARWASEGFAEATAAANRELPHESAVLGEGPGGLTVELGEMRLAAWRAMHLPVRWRSSTGSLVIDATFGVLPVQDGRENPVTELLLHGAFGTEAGRRMHPVTWVHRIVDVVGQRLTATTGGAVEHCRPRVPGVRLAGELSHPGG
jgi:hypothetical protein